MSDKTKHNDAAAPVKSRKSSKILSKLKSLAALCGEVADDGDDLVRYEDFREENKELKEEVKKKDAQIAALEQLVAKLKQEQLDLAGRHKRDESLLVEKFAEHASRWTEDSSVRKKQENHIESLEKSVADAHATIDSFNEKLELAQSESEQRRAAHRQAKDEIARYKVMEKKLDAIHKLQESQQSELHRCHYEMGLVRLEVTQTKAHITSIAADCHSLARKYFYPTAGGCSQPDLEGLGDFVTGQFLQWFDFQQSNCLYMSLAETIICRTLCERVFRPFYVLDTAEARGRLDSIAQSDPRRETLLRCQLVAAFSDEEASALASEAAQITADRLFPPGQGRPVEALEDLAKFFHRSICIWRELQGSETPISIEWEHHDWDEANRHDDYDALVPLPEEYKRFCPEYAHALATLFPRIFLGDDVLFEGIALWTTQNAAVTAAVVHGGYDKRATGAPSLRRLTSHRRASGVYNLNGVKSGPGSPRAESFSERVYAGGGTALRSSRHERGQVV